jgi:uncharacterized repeat protein (TIGR03803 family)
MTLQSFLRILLRASLLAAISIAVTPNICRSQTALRTMPAKVLGPSVMLNIHAPAPPRVPLTTAYRILHHFTGSPDGASPYGPLISVNGVLYGTTLGGGKYGFGTAFEIPPTGKEVVLYSFPGGAGGASPTGLTFFDGALYGTTQQGGYGNGGTVFALTLSGVSKVLYRFGHSYSDGWVPSGTPVPQAGELYGTTVAGGGSPLCLDGCGTIYKINAAGTESVLHRFQGGYDGAYPEGLIAAYGWLFGTTEPFGPSNFATVYEVNSSGVKWVINTLAANPVLTPLHGALFGTTHSGGYENNGFVFGETGLESASEFGYDFGMKTGDGTNPQGGLAAMNGDLFGTTLGGGAHSEGTVFRLTRASVETVLYSFGSISHDGLSPNGELLAINGSLFGTSEYGGAGNCSGPNSCGTVFELRP